MDTPDDRAVSAVVGFMLVFGFVVTSFALYQGIVVPDQNRAIEFDHNQAVHRQFLELRSALVTAAEQGTATPVTVALGTDYPHRPIASNFGRATGSLSTGPTANVSIRNVTALDRETRDYLGADGSQLGPFPNRPITYRPTYPHYTDPPTTRLANTVAHNRFPSGATVALSEQTVIEGRQLTLVTVTGDLTEAGAATVAVTPTPLSAPMTRLTVTNHSGPLTIVLPTTLTPSDWRSLLDDEFDPDGTAAGNYVTGVDAAGEGAVAISLEGNVTYELRLARIGIGRSDTAPPARYLTDVHGDDAAVAENAIHRLTVEVRDRYNNPVSGVPVSATVTDGPGHLDGVTEIESDTAGRATFTYRAPPDLTTTRPVTVEATFGPAPDARRTVRFDLTAVPTGAGSAGDGLARLNPASPVQYVDTTTIGRQTVAVTFTNTVDERHDFTHTRVSFAFHPAGNPPSSVKEIANASTGTVYQSTPLDIGGPLVRFDTRPLSLPPGRSTVAVTFDAPLRDGFFVMTLRSAEGTNSTYIIHTD